MIEAPKPKYPRLRALSIYGGSALFAAGVLVVAMDIASQCQCHYTPVLFAERDGLRKIVLDVHVAEESRHAFVESLAALDVFVDPAYSSGQVPIPAVFGKQEQAVEIQTEARRFARELAHRDDSMGFFTALYVSMAQKYDSKYIR